MRAHRLASIGILSVVVALAAADSVSYTESATHDSNRGSPQHASSAVDAAGIDDTGATDVTAQIQNLINSLPNGSSLAFARNGKYRIEGTIHVRNKSNITIEGNSSVFFATTRGTRARGQWSFDGGSNVVVQNVIVKGANPNAGTSPAAYVARLEAQHAFNISGTDGIELDHVTATDVYGDFVYIGLQTGGRLSRNVYIHDSTFARNGRQGISVTGGDGVRIIHNSISDVRRSTFDLEPNGRTWGALNVDVEYNTIGAGRLNLIASKGVGPVANITFSHNVIYRGANSQIGVSSGTPRGPFTIEDNTSMGEWAGDAGSGLLSFTNVVGVTVTGNTLPLQAGRGDYGIVATDSCDVTARGNTFANAVAPLRVTLGPDCAATAGHSTTTTSSAA